MHEKSAGAPVNDVVSFINSRLYRASDMGPVAQLSNPIDYLCQDYPHPTHYPFTMRFLVFESVIQTIKTLFQSTQHYTYWPTEALHPPIINTFSGGAFQFQMNSPSLRDPSRLRSTVTPRYE
jgi:hypothetical protein